ncbi:MAG TPA: hypothetical protein VFA15_09275, partial [Nitrososphaera sp.]|nr:hypothetical protein [Nitrososphaera sp.]
MTEKKKNSVLGGILDLIILVLIVGGAGYFGYITGLNQRLAPVQLVPAGTLGAIWPAKENGPAKPETPASSEASAQASNQNSKSSETVASAETETASSPATAKPSG